MERFVALPFNYFSTGRKKKCPKCGAAHNPVRELCYGKFVVFGKKCPVAEHFHHSCKSCGGQWCESTMEDDALKLKESLKVYFQKCLKADVKEEEITDIWRTEVISSVMKD
jgi:hypothetical protein